MPTNAHASAILRWRETVDKQDGGLAGFQEAATISTMLFGCNRWLETQSGTAAADEMSAIEDIKSELEAWLRQRGRTFIG